MYAFAKAMTKFQRTRSIVRKQNPANNEVLTDDEDYYGNWFLHRVRFNRACQALDRVQNNGLLMRQDFLRSCGKRGNDEFLAQSLPASELMQAFVSQLRNGRSIAEEVGDLDSEEKAFLEVFSAKDFYVTHATERKVSSKSGDLILFSRKRLVEKGTVFPEDHSMEEDIEELGNDDYVFFSLEVGEKSKKKESRFGGLFYRVNYSHPIFDFSSMSLLDQLNMQIPQPSIVGLSNDARATLRARKYTRLNILFHGREDSMKGLACSIIEVARMLPERDKQIILCARSDDEVNRVINWIFRPEIRVPGIFAVREGSYSVFGFSDD
jgi:insecticidal toxin complex protein TccC